MPDSLARCSAAATVPMPEILAVAGQHPFQNVARSAGSEYRRSLYSQADTQVVGADEQPTGRARRAMASQAVGSGGGFDHSESKQVEWAFGSSRLRQPYRPDGY